MTVRPRGRGFQVDVKLPDKRIRRTMATRDEALAFEASVLAAHRTGAALPPTSRGRPVTDSTTISAFAARVARLRWSHVKTGDRAARDAELFVEFVGPRLAVADALTDERIHDYVSSLSGIVSGRTINRRLSSVSALAKAAVADRLIAAAPTIPWRANAPGRLRWYTDAETADILNVATTLDQRYAHLFAFLVDTGCRLGEAERLTWGDIRSGTALFVGTKNGTTRGVRLTPRAARAVEGLREQRGGPFHFVQRHVLRSIWDRLRGRLAWMDDSCVVHTFRHTCASRLVQGGVDLYHVQNWLGHLSPTMTQRYSHLAPGNYDHMAAVLSGGGGGDRTRSMSDFKSDASTNFATPPTGA